MMSAEDIETTFDRLSEKLDAVKAQLDIIEEVLVRGETGINQIREVAEPAINALTSSAMFRMFAPKGK